MSSRETRSAATFAERYETVLVPVVFEPWARELVSRAAPRESESVLDLACGTGIVTREFARTGVSLGSLTGTDHSPDMLAVAREMAADESIDANWVEADAADLPFPDDGFDLGVCQQALQFFPDRPGALRELRRTMKGGGRVVFGVQRELSVNPMLQSQAAALEKNVGPEASAAVKAICALSDKNEIQGLFEDAGFMDIDIESVSLTLYHPDGRAYAEGAMAGMHTGDKLSQLSGSQREQCVDDFLAGLADFREGAAIKFPHVSHVIAARA